MTPRRADAVSAHHDEISTNFAGSFDDFLSWLAVDDQTCHVKPLASGILEKGSEIHFCPLPCLLVKLSDMRDMYVRVRQDDGQKRQLRSVQLGEFKSGYQCSF